ncbi:MAG TPA: SGNH/GDSL hydrolase family protein [candidate division Zixibacteria bacterium]|nr:SGNH/GDSL hydrolase family protein [candidate division Zixibacteria bacterium]
MSKKMLFSIVAFLLFLVLLEMSARLLEFSLSKSPEDIKKERGWQAEFFGSYFDWHQSDPDLLWRFKPHLANRLIQTNSDGILGREIPKEKQAETTRILILGDSSPVGLGLKTRDHAFDAILEYLLKSQYLGKRNFEIINGAVSGYTSEQIKRFLELKGWSYEPDIIILYCGNNDASISGYYTDREIMSRQVLKKPRRFLAGFAFYRVIRDIITSRKEIEELNDTNRPLSPRVTPEQYGENLTDIAEQCRRHDCPLIILKPPVPYLWPAGLQFKVFAHLTGGDGQLIFPKPIADIIGRKLKYCIDKNRSKELYGGIDIFTRAVYNSAYDDSMTNDEAIEYYSSKLLKDKKNHLFYNNMGIAFWKSGQYFEADYSFRVARTLYQKEHEKDSSIAALSAGAPYLYNTGINLISEARAGIEILNDSSSAAFAYLDSALQLDYFSLRIKRTYFKQIDEVSKYDNVTVIDLPAIFRDQGGEKLFIDHCHPTFKGHYIIAEEILKVFKTEFRL